MLSPCNADSGHPCDADEGQPCAACATWLREQEAEHRRSYDAATPAEREEWVDAIEEYKSGGW